MNDFITPRNNTALYGHEEIAKMLVDEVRSGKLPHGMIFSGMLGIGKATLAYRFSRMLLSGGYDMNVSSESPIFRRIAAGSHTDLLTVEPAYDSKKEEQGADIKIDQARGISQYLSLTAAEGKWRVVIIDSADNLNTNSANSILKTLEEPPPQTVIMLISHNVGSLLPTIRSRCRVIQFKPLSQKNFYKALGLVAPDIYGDELKTLEILSGRSVGVAVELKMQGATIMYNEILEILAEKNLDNARIYSFCEQITSGKRQHSSWRLFSHIMLCILERVTKKSAKIQFSPANEEEGEALSNISKLHSPDIWADKWQEAAEQFLLAQRLHLDYKQVALAFFHSLASAEEFNLGNIAA